MSKTQKELAFLRDLYIETDWTERFTNLFDDNFKFTKEEKVLYVNAGTGSHALALRKKLKEKVELFAASETKELLKLAQAKADAVKADVQFSTDFPKGKFDAVLAMYHDQGLIPFKSLSIGEGVNYTAGISGVRTSPDHGTAFDIAGKNQADEGSFRAAIFTCVDIINNRKTYEENRKNPLKKVSASIVANAVDEKIVEEG